MLLFPEATGDEWTQARAAQASVVGALSRDIIFVRVAPATYALQALVAAARKPLHRSEPHATPASTATDLTAVEAGPTTSSSVALPAIPNAEPAGHLPNGVVPRPNDGLLAAGVQGALPSAMHQRDKLRNPQAHQARPPPAYGLNHMSNVESNLQVASALPTPRHIKSETLSHGPKVESTIYPAQGEDKAQSEENGEVPDADDDFESGSETDDEDDWEEVLTLCIAYLTLSFSATGLICTLSIGMPLLPL